MQLYWTPASPFTRKVCVVARELGLWEQIEVLPTTWTLDWGYRTPAFTAGLAEANPVARIPTLVTDDGIAIGDSTLICLHLLERTQDHLLLPESSVARQRMWSTYGVADGVLEAQIAMRAELLRHPQLEAEATLSRSFLEKQRDRIRRCLDALEVDEGLQYPGFNLAQITTAIALSYQDWREWLFDFRQDHPRLADWYERVRTRPSLVATVPQETPTHE